MFETVRIIQISRMMTELFINLRQTGPAQTIMALAQINQDQIGITAIAAQLRGQGFTHIRHRREGGNNQRQRRGHAFLFAVFLPDRFHGHGILAHRNGNAQRRAQFQPHRLDRIIQPGVFAGMTGRGHPVGGEHDTTDVFNFRRSKIGQRLTHRHSRGSRVMQQRHRGALAHRHRLTGHMFKVGGGDRHIGHRRLPGADHLIPRHHAGDAAIADGD